jgi:hypothetical protein
MKKAIGSIAIVLAVVVVVVAGWLFWGSWVSPAERRAMRDALDRIDEVARYEGSEQAIYSQKLRVAKAAIIGCQKKAVTAYDKQLLPALDFQLDGAQEEHTARLTANIDARCKRRLEVVEDSNRQTEMMLRKNLQ